MIQIPTEVSRWPIRKTSYFPVQRRFNRRSRKSWENLGRDYQMTSGRENVYWQFSKADRLGRISAVKISETECHFSIKPASAETFGWRLHLLNLSSSSCLTTFQLKWTAGKMAKFPIHKSLRMQIWPHWGGVQQKALLNICCGKTSVFIPDFYPWSPLFISDSYHTHFTSLATPYSFFSSFHLSVFPSPVAVAGHFLQSRDMLKMGHWQQIYFPNKNLYRLGPDRPSANRA